MQLILLAFKSLWAEPGTDGKRRGTASDPSTRTGPFLGHRHSGRPLHTEELRPPTAFSALRDHLSHPLRTARGAPRDSQKAESAVAKLPPKDIRGGSSSSPECCWFPQAAEMERMVLCLLDPKQGENPCLNSHGSRRLSWAWVSPCRTQLFSQPCRAPQEHGPHASHQPLSSGTLLSALSCLCRVPSLSSYQI